MFPTLFLDVGDRVFFAPRRAVGPLAGEGIIHVHNREKARRQRDAAELSAAACVAGVSPLGRSRDGARAGAGYTLWRSLYQHAQAGGWREG